MSWHGLLHLSAALPVSLEVELCKNLLQKTSARVVTLAQTVVALLHLGREVFVAAFLILKWLRTILFLD